MNRGTLRIAGVLGALWLGGSGCSLLINPDVDELRADAGDAGAGGTGGGAGSAGMGGNAGAAGIGGTGGTAGVGGTAGIGGSAGMAGIGGTGGTAGTAGTGSFQPSNVGELTFLPQPGDLTIPAGEQLFDSTNCSASGFATQKVEQATGSPLCVVQVHDLTLAAGATLRVQGERALVFLASGAVTIAGTLDAAATGNEPGPGGGRGGVAGNAGSQPGDGQGVQAGGAGVATAQNGGNRSGGGGGAHCGRGGNGGLVMSLAGNTAGGLGAEARANAAAPLRGGSGGGRGAGANGTRGLGGGGGGAIQISALGTIFLNGAIWVSGGGGVGGIGGLGGLGGGGGGGSAGMVLLEAPVIEVGSGARIGASGGGGGAAAGGSNGGDGRGLLTAAAGGTGVVAGGASGGGTTADATNGEGVTSLMPVGTVASAGGGGGAGCIVVRTAFGQLPTSLSAQASPSVAPGLISAPL